ncbi:2-dehydro-3-deoxy-6-phosphogalactonate aldolase [Undibacterium sp. RuRC25W]|uniref:2-dehydro-3-deoxy-6-phosphogalactonate aldolase n=1 Tax=Undibacterium sp. RuRC25W TaxID=3413047 RepID=UPI003BF213DF
MKSIVTPFDLAFNHLPLVAILRGITPLEVETVGHALYEEGFRLIEVPLNSPNALASIKLLRHCLPADAVIGAGTVLTQEAVVQVRDAGGTLIVMPHADVNVIKAARNLGLFCLPGIATLTEAFAAIHAGADALKIFPAELITPAILKAMKVVLPPALPLLPVGGITPERMPSYREAGAAGFGLGSVLYAPGMTAEDVAKRARQFVKAWK